MFSQGKSSRIVQRQKRASKLWKFTLQNKSVCEVPIHFVYFICGLHAGSIVGAHFFRRSCLYGEWRVLSRNQISFHEGSISLAPSFVRFNAAELLFMGLRYDEIYLVFKNWIDRMDHVIRSRGAHMPDLIFKK